MSLLSQSVGLITLELQENVGTSCYDLLIEVRSCQITLKLQIQNAIRPTVCCAVNVEILSIHASVTAALVLFSLGLLLIVLRRREGQTVTKKFQTQCSWSDSEFDPVVRPWNKSLLQTSHKSHCTQETFFFFWSLNKTLR